MNPFTLLNEIYSGTHEQEMFVNKTFFLKLRSTQPENGCALISNAKRIEYQTKDLHIHIHLFLDDDE